jgi:hypothetical protein
MHGELVSPKKFTEADQALAHAISSLNSDVNAIQEVDHFHSRTDSVNQSASIAAAAGHSYWAFLPLFIVEVDRVRNIVASDPQIISSQNPHDLPSYGITITSKQKPLAAQRFHACQVWKVDDDSRCSNPTKIFARDHSRAALAAIYEDKIVINTHLSALMLFHFFNFLNISWRFIDSLK